LYFIGAEGLDFIKVGKSRNPAGRLRQLRTASPYKLRLLRTYEGLGHLEAAILTALRDRVALDGEWFLGPELDFDALVAEAERAHEGPVVTTQGDLSFSQVLGRAITLARQALGWTQNDLCRVAHLSQKYVSEIENGRVDPRISIVKRIAKALGVPIGQLTKDDTDSERKAAAEALAVPASQPQRQCA
jgi:DNA-binding XRE family transcriptional regulator